MSRCFPFPPPGYVKSTPVELELSLKKEKRKHKEKKKKRKKHSATNDDLTIKEDDRQLKDVEQSGQPKEGFHVGKDELPSATTSQAPIERLQTRIRVEEAFANANLSTQSKQEDRFKPREELSLRSTLAAEKLQAGNSRRHVVSKGVNGVNSSQRSQGAKPMVEGLGVATIDKNSRLDASRVPSLGVPLASNIKSPEQAENLAFSNGVLSTKRKRLQADNSEDGLLSKSAIATDFQKSDGLHVGRPGPDLLMQATKNTSLQADNSDKLLTSKNGLLTDLERSRKKLRVDNSRLNVGTNGAACSSNIGEVENGEGKEMPYHLMADGTDLQEGMLKPTMHSNVVKATNRGKTQMKSSSIRQSINGTVTFKNTDESDKRLQPAKISLTNPMRDPSMSNSPANRLDEIVRSGPSMARKCEQSEQRLQGTTNILPNGVLIAKGKQPEADSTKGEARSNNVRATCEERSHIDSSQHDMRVLDVQINAEKICNPLSLSATDFEQTCLRMQADGLKSRVLSNGVLAGHQEESNQPSKVAANDSSSARSVAVHDKTATPIKKSSSSKASLDLEEMSFKEKLMKLHIPSPKQAWITPEDQDWLVPHKQQLQLKQGEKGEEAQIEVWAEVVLLPKVGLNALPYVIPY